MDYVDVGNERRTLEAETGQLPGARVYRLVPLKEQRLRERDRLAISGTITCASCGRSTAVTDIEVTLRRTLFDEGLVHTWTCPQCENHTIISAFITTNGDAERAYWLAVQRDSDPMNSGPAMGWPTLTIDTLSSGSFEQVFAPVSPAAPRCWDQRDAQHRRRSAALIGASRNIDTHRHPC